MPPKITLINPSNETVFDNSRQPTLSAKYENYYTDTLSAGTLDYTNVSNSKLVLNYSLAPYEDRHSTGITLSNNGYAWYEQRIQALKSEVIYAVNFYARIATGLRLEFRDDAGTVLASKTMDITTDGWYTFVLDNLVWITEGNYYNIRINQTNSRIYRETNVLYVGTMWKAISNLLSNGSYYNETLGLGLVTTGEYYTSGKKTSSPIALYGTANNAIVSWNETVNANTSIVTKCAINTDNLTMPLDTDFSQVSNGSVFISNGTDLTGKYLWIRTELSTNEIHQTPYLNSITADVYTTEKGTITFDIDITSNFNSSYKQNGSVANLNSGDIAYFTPSSLVEQFYQWKATAIDSNGNASKLGSFQISVGQTAIALSQYENVSFNYNIDRRTNTEALSQYENVSFNYTMDRWTNTEALSEYENVIQYQGTGRKYVLYI